MLLVLLFVDDVVVRCCVLLRVVCWCSVVVGVLLMRLLFVFDAVVLVVCVCCMCCWLCACC